jgi:hypothetical protein
MASKSKVQYILVNGTVRRLKAGLDMEAAIAHLRIKGYKAEPCDAPPTLATMERWSDNGIARATDGCRVEPDGTCPHGHKSWLLVLGCI